MKLSINFWKIKDKIISIFSYLKKKWNELLDFVYDHYFVMNILSVLGLWIIIGMDFEWVKAVRDIDEVWAKQWDFVFYSFLIWAFLLWVQVIKLLLFEAKTKLYKKELTKEWYTKFLEYEYKRNNQSFFTGLPYIITLVASIVAICVSIISMQISIDIVSSGGIENWKVVLKWAQEMSGSFWAWSWTLFVIFIFYFFWYKFNQLSKRDVLERLYYWQYRK